MTLLFLRRGERRTPPARPFLRRHVTLCVFLVSSGAVLVLVCRAALVLAHLARSHGAFPSRNAPPVVRETAVLAVHVRAPVHRDPADRVAASQLVRARGASVQTDGSAAADANIARRRGDRGTVELDDLLVAARMTGTRLYLAPKLELVSTQAWKS